MKRQHGPAVLNAKCNSNAPAAAKATRCTRRLASAAEGTHGSPGLLARQSYSLVAYPSAARCEYGQAGSRRMYATPRRRGAEAPRQAQVSSWHRQQSGPCCLLRRAPAARMQVCPTVRTPSSKPMQPCHARTVHKPLGARGRCAVPNPSFKATPNSLACPAASAGPSAHFALAARHATLSGSP